MQNDFSILRDKLQVVDATSGICLGEAIVFLILCSSLTESVNCTYIFNIIKD
jgi:hypothetical protein